jgi:hypothetical protein
MPAAPRSGGRILSGIDHGSRRDMPHAHDVLLEITLVRLPERVFEI